MDLNRYHEVLIEVDKTLRDAGIDTSPDGVRTAIGEAVMAVYADAFGKKHDIGIYGQLFNACQDYIHRRIEELSPGKADASPPGA
jgi:hypothetical protein